VRDRKAARPILFLLGLAALAGCASSRTLLSGPEGESAERFFAREAEGAAFPVRATFSGVAISPGRGARPFIVGVNAVSPGAESLGLYDPMGGAVAFLANDGATVEISRGPMADLAGAWEAMRLAAGPLSLGRVLSGAPGYPVAGGEPARGGDGSWSLSDGRQTLRTDPGRAFLAGAEYRVDGVKVTVEYPERTSAAPPARVELKFRGLRISLRRDPE